MLSSAPDWLWKWVSNICRFIDFEEKQMIEVFRVQMSELYPNTILYEHEFLNAASNLAYWRLNSLTITIDKVMHYMERVNC